MRAPPKPFALRTRLRAVLALLAVLTALAATGAVGSAVACHTGRIESERLEEAARRATQVGLLAREQYIHEAHTVLVGDQSHVGHHDAWVGRLHSEIEAVRPLLLESERSQLESVESRSREVARLFAEEILPAVMRGDRPGVAAAHARADGAVQDMTHTADHLAVTLTTRARAAETAAERTSWIVTALVVATAIFAASFGLIVASRLWREVAGPLAELERTARRVGEGDRTARMGQPALLELASLAAAFDLMLDTLAAQEEALRAADRLAAIGRVASGIAHELNNPLGVIRGYLKTLRRGAADERLATDLATIDGEAAVCQRIVEDLLAYARVPGLHKSAVDAADLAAQAVERSAPGGPTGDVRIDVERTLIEVDPVRIRQVLVNLIRNARQASTTEGVELRGVREADGTFRYRVLDRGEGLGDEARTRLFEPFFTTRADGTGLGLAVSHGLVAAHGGELRALGREGGGTEVELTLPGAAGGPTEAT